MEMQSGEGQGQRAPSRRGRPGVASFELIRARGRSKSEPALCPGESAEDKNHKEMKARKSPDKLSVRLDGPEAPHRPVLEDRRPMTFSFGRKPQTWESSEWSQLSPSSPDHCQTSSP